MQLGGRLHLLLHESPVGIERPVAPRPSSFSLPPRPGDFESVWSRDYPAVLSAVKSVRKPEHSIVCGTEMNCCATSDDEKFWEPVDRHQLP